MAGDEFVHHYYSDAVGWLELRVSDQGVRAVSFVKPPTQPMTSTQHPLMWQLITELDEYFSNKSATFSVPLDPASGTTFQRRVWEQLTLIPYGQTCSYADIAKKVGNPRACRAVGSANKNNPIAILIPCHRVIRADGSLGGYSSGIGIKKTLLHLEGAGLPTAEA